MSTQGNSGSASGGQLEEKVDFSKETDEKLEQCKTLCKAGALQEALVLLAALEKRCRTGNDNISLGRVCEAAVQCCKDVGDDEAVLQTLTTFATKRSQKMAAIKALVSTAFPWCVTAPYTPVSVSNEAEKTVRDKLVETLRDITDGKLFLERERAQLTRALAVIKEEEGDIAAAADVLQEVHVETYGSLSKKEKVEFILEQLRLTLGKQDFVRAAIVAGKVNRKHLQDGTMDDYKVRFFTLLATLHRQEKNAFELVKDYFAIYSTLLKDHEAGWKEALQATVLFLALSPYGNEQQDMLNRVSQDPNLEKLPACQTTIQMLLKKEIINYPLPHQQELESLPSFQEGDDGLAQHWHDMFHRRIIQHNVRVAALYYTKIHGSRLAQLLQLEPTRLEQEIAAMVSEGSVYAKIDRPADIVRFQAKQTADSILSDWAGDIDKLLHLVETTTHLIHKEQMTSQ